METRIITLDENNLDRMKIIEASNIIKRGDVVAFPTETVYGLGANALDETAIKKIYAAKGRPSDNPLIVHISSIDMLNSLVREVPDKAKRLIKYFWPGPLTIIFKKKEIVPNIVTGGLDTVAIRMPSNKIALELIKQSNLPIAAPSANTSGKPSPTCDRHVVEDLSGKIPMILSGGSCEIGLESTVIDLTSKVPTILRPGRISAFDIEKVIGKITVSQIAHGSKKNISLARSPGMKYRHYSPNAEVIFVDGTKKKMHMKILELLAENKDKKIVTIGFINYPSTKHFICKTKSEMAHVLFDKFREADSEKIDIIIVEGFSNRGIGLALKNRIKKAARKIIEI